MKTLRHRSSAALLGLWLVLNGAVASAEEAFYSVRVADVELTEGQRPEYDLSATFSWSFPWRERIPAPYAAIDGDGEAMIEMENRLAPWSFTQQNLLDARLLVRIPAAREVTGRLYLPAADFKSFVIAKFRIPANQASVSHRDAFYQGKITELQGLLSDRVPGTAWFRHALREAQRASNQAVQAPPADTANFNRFDVTNLDDTYALFSGGRALSENLALESPVTTAREGGLMSVELESIAGITIAEIDWSKQLAGKNPTLDPLAKSIPADQHAVLFPTFAAFLRSVDELRGQSAPILRLTEPRAEDARSLARYETQLGVPLNSAARLLGGQVVKSVALTGGDPYFRVGTDVALVFETSNPEALRELLWANMKLNARGDASVREVSVQIGDVKYAGLRSEDRRISGYVAILPGAVMLTNSPYQVERAAAVIDGRAESLASLPEFKFFRDRYPFGDKQETAFVFLSDATIRRWCGPKWRIAGSRRTRDVAVLAEMQATYLERIVRGEAQPGPIHTDLTMVSAGELMLEKSGVRSPVYNTLDFQTPISELLIEKVTPEEAAAYGRWRDGYERNWRWAFDPIGVRLSLGDQAIGADMTVMPLIANSEYGRFITITQGAKIPPGAGDPHDTLAHFIVAINHDALSVKQYAGLATAMAPGAKIDVLSWLGDTIGIYLDRDPIWAELLNPTIDNAQREALLREQGYRVPVALRVDSKSNLKLAGFLTGARAFIEQTAPGLTAWESLKYQDQAYVKIGATAQAGEDGVPENAAIYYGVIGGALVLSPSEGVIKHAIDRQLAKAGTIKEQQAETNPEPWLGENVALQADRAAADAQFALSGDQYRLQLRRLSWNNLPILNEWRRLFPDQDPVQVHETYWQARLVCAGGGEYVLNDEYQTMESTVFGSPANPKLGPDQVTPLDQLKRGNFGLTFEAQGLRVRMELKRATPEKSN